MKVLMFGWEFPPHNSGGLGVACQGMARALSVDGVEVIFALPQKLQVQEKLKFVFANNVLLSARSKNFPPNPYITSRLYAESLLEEVMRYAIWAKDVASVENFDVIHAHDWLSFPAGVMAKKISGKPLVVHIHATEFDRGGKNINDRVYKVEKTGMETADKVITVSEFTKKLVMKKYGIPEEKITVVHNGVDPSDYPGQKEKDLGLTKLKEAGYKIVLFLGRITLQKGPDYFIKAAKKVLEYQPKTIFVVVGSGDMEGKVMQLASSLGISGNFIFPGFLREKERSRIYRSADVFVMPSVSEPFGITALESALLGTPIVMSKQSGASEVILHSLKIDFWDTEEIADKILSVLSYPSMKKEMVKNGGREARNCSWTKTAAKLQNVYSQICPLQCFNQSR